MIFTNNLLGALASVLKLARPQAQDANLSIPPMVMLTSQAPFPISVQLPGISTPITNSVSAVQNVIVANAGAGSSDILTLDEGVWDIAVAIAYHANYTTAGGGADAEVRFVIPSGNVYIFNAYAGTGQINALYRQTMTFLDSCIVRMFLSANAAGNVHRLHCSVIANRLL